MVIENRLAQVIREKSAEWGRDVTYDDICDATGLSRATIARMKSDGKGVRFDALSKLCEFFHCQVGDILVYIPDDPATPPAG